MTNRRREENLEYAYRMMSGKYKTEYYNENGSCICGVCHHWENDIFRIEKGTNYIWICSKCLNICKTGMDGLFYINNKL